jgi:hypothetical protein
MRTKSGQDAVPGQGPYGAVVPAPNSRSNRLAGRPLAAAPENPPASSLGLRSSLRGPSPFERLHLNGMRGFRQLGRSLPSVARRYQSVVGFVSLLLLGQFRLLQCDGISSCGPLAPGPSYFSLAKTTADPHAAQTRMDRMVIRRSLSRPGNPFGGS